MTIFIDSWAWILWDLRRYRLLLVGSLHSFSDLVDSTLDLLPVTFYYFDIYFLVDTITILYFVYIYLAMKGEDR
jgi:hypothetical protein